VVGGALDPELRLLLVGDRVVRGVVLDEWEALGVIAKTLVRLLRDVLGIPTGGDESRIGPRTRPDEDLIPA